MDSIEERHDTSQFAFTPHVIISYFYATLTGLCRVCKMLSILMSNINVGIRTAGYTIATKRQQ